MQDDQHERPGAAGQEESTTREAVRVEAARVRKAARYLAFQPTAARNDALRHIARALRSQTREILEANAKDLARGRARGLEPAFLDRLTLSETRIGTMAGAVEDVVALDDPIGGMDRVWTRPNGLRVGSRRIPLGVIGIIYESRPNVTSDAACLCIKSGNGVLLKGGSDAFESNAAVYRAIRQGLKASALPDEAAGAVGFVHTRDRAAVRAMLDLEADIDVLIPRGGHGLIQFVTQHAKMPVIKHDAGVCHVVVDASADAAMVDRVVLNSKAQRTGVCNAAETLLLTRAAARRHGERLLRALCDAGVTLHACDEARAFAARAGVPDTLMTPADEAAYRAEFLSMDIAVRVVDDLTAAIDHIEEYGSKHTEALLTSRLEASERFQAEVDASCVIINASTRFNDGAQLGLGAEIGISTTKLHAYGPMGLRELTTTKFIVTGEGQVRS